MNIPSVLERLRALLGERGIPFEEIRHAPVGRATDYSRLLGTRLEQQAKCLLVQLKSKPNGPSEYVLVALPAQKRLDMARFQDLTAADSARLADRDSIESITGCAFGALPPVGSIMGLRLFFDCDLFREERIYFNAGRLDVSMTLAPSDLATAERAIVF